MNVGRSMTLFIGFISVAFVYVCNAIPQIKSEAVAGEEATIGESPEELRAAGRRIFESDVAQCLTCHSLTEDPKARCPNQDGIGERSSTRKPGMSAAAYLVESLYNPNAYVVAGYPRNQMQPVNRPPIALSHDEILAVIVFLNSLGGTIDEEFVEEAKKAQDPWRKGLLKPEEGEETFVLPVFPGDPVRGKTVFDEQKCNACHRIGAEGQEICPDLSAIGASQTPQYILESILDPNAVIVKGYRDSLVAWKEAGRNPLRGRPMKWIPDKEHPKTLVLNVDEDGERVDVTIDLAEVAAVGDMAVEMEPEHEEADPVYHYGEYVSGDEKEGVVLRMLEDGNWVERRIPPKGIASVGRTGSPMPANMAQQLTPREVYDLLAYLLAQKQEAKK